MKTNTTSFILKLLFLSFFVLSLFLIFSCQPAKSAEETVQEHRRTKLNYAYVPALPKIKVRYTNGVVMFLEVPSADLYRRQEKVVVNLRSQKPSICQNCITTGNDDSLAIATVIQVY